MQFLRKIKTHSNPDGNFVSIVMKRGIMSIPRDISDFRSYFCGNLSVALPVLTSPWR